MKKNLLAIGALVLSVSAVSAQQVVSYIGNEALLYVKNNTLFYNGGGGMKMKGAGVVENHGNIMIVGGPSDVFQAVHVDGALKTTESNFYNRIDGYDSSQPFSVIPGQERINYTYGQLYISGLKQSNITALVSEEYQRELHGDYQQIGIPFYDKQIIPGLSSDFDVSFTDERWSKTEILKWNNGAARFDKVELTDRTGNVGHDYYIIGAGESVVKSIIANEKTVIVGRPYAEENTPDVQLIGAAAGVNYGVGGNNRNIYNEKYNTYIEDGFFEAATGEKWVGAFGRDMYQFSNPYLTNLDLANIARDEPGAVTDGVNVSNIYGVRLEPSGVKFNKNDGSSSAAYKYITYDINNGGLPVGDIAYGMVRPMSTFIIRLRNGNSASFSFKNLRRFDYSSRADGVDYSVSAGRNSNSTLKQLGIIGLDADGEEIARTYYVVSPSATTGFENNSLSQSVQYVNSEGAVLGSYEEDINGGVDINVESDYWLYINEANENDFQGKNIRVVSFSPNIKSYRFEIRENAKLVDEGVHALSQGIGFYYKGTDGEVKEVKQADIISLEDYDTSGVLEYDFFYGAPISSVLGVDDTKVSSETQIVYNHLVDNYVVLFDPSWKKADIKVYDLSGRIVLSDSDIDTSTNYEIKLDKDIRSGYIVDLISDDGQKLTKKILK